MFVFCFFPNKRHGIVLFKKLSLSLFLSVLPFWYSVNDLIKFSTPVLGWTPDPHDLTVPDDDKITIGRVRVLTISKRLHLNCRE